MKKIKVDAAVGTVVAHDLTRIVPGECKGTAFKKGYIIKEKDIETLKSIGKNHLNIIELSDDELHENEAAQRIANASAGEGIILEGPSEGKIQLKAKERGILKINLHTLEAINDIGALTLATLHNNTLVNKNQSVAATRAIPLVIKKDKIEKVEDICKKLGKAVSVKEIQSLKVGIIITGSEVYEGKIEDKFAPVFKEKIKYYGCKLTEIIYAPDHEEKIEGGIKALIKNGAEVVIATGGMSVDADDVTPIAIKNVSDRVVSYGVPALPGNMLMLAYLKDVAIFGIPGAGMYFKTTSFDLIFPRILAGEKIEKKDITSLAHGGLCLMCENCTYPICPFGK
ncbi:molybdopterin-binding protein [Clostridium botulinum]|uniref:molybdopterin-binding protein n=1 Tax=Clostridium botulinum TaxID=1491 RepID=UPI00052CB5FB|nr:molybdopterin-binding protein [Clostridium botulinum]KGM92975.1 molybdopterin-binding protein [Clostridium botulinum D str. CCUG 7971]NFO97579.1 molybdopterin-binding protein [Clostridium botulinum]OOV52896.1 molybdopterin-binding protein [Clostridium botulinum D/C]OOV54221.1 molybdopterin-binding protein [Clostridium botulinum D/C]OOV54350.1 molybdopterin-binding protein [Clostridium botulinum D/C]